MRIGYRQTPNSPELIGEGNRRQARRAEGNRQIPHRQAPKQRVLSGDPVVDANVVLFVMGYPRKGIAEILKQQVLVPEVCQRVEAILDLLGDRTDARSRNDIARKRLIVERVADDGREL